MRSGVLIFLALFFVSTVQANDTMDYRNFGYLSEFIPKYEERSIKTLKLLEELQKQNQQIIANQQTILEEIRKQNIPPKKVKK